jgi:predicted TIM-barrel enzyme
MSSTPLEDLLSKSIGPILLPVIHLFDAEQAVSNARIAFESGCHGIWLIAHGSNETRKQTELLVECYDAVRQQWPAAWIGVNVLQLMWKPDDLFGWVMQHMPTVNGVWTDQCFATKEGTTEHMARIMQARARAGFVGVYFGGFAFKHQPLLVDSQEGVLTEEDRAKLANLAKAASRFVDVLVTSGTATGVTPNLVKVETVHDAVHPLQPLALSGAGMELDVFAPHAEIFLAATALQADCPRHHTIDGCSASFCNLSPERVAKWVALAAAIADRRRENNTNNGGQL